MGVLVDSVRFESTPTEPNAMNLEQARQFRVLSDEEFNTLTTAEKAEYLRNAIAARNAINRQIDANLMDNLAKKDS